MNKWFFINVMFLVFTWIKIITFYHGIHTVVGGTALTLVLYNWSRHAIFSTIRSPYVSRKRKITLAKLSKSVLPFHKWTGSLALVIAIIHIVLVLQSYGLQIRHFKQVSGLLSITTLIFLVLFGWLRWYKTTVRRRYIHWTLGYISIFMIILHVIL